MNNNSIGKTYSKYDRIVAIDGKDFLRSNSTKSFRGVIGTAVEFSDPPIFIKKYEEIISDLKEKFGIKTKLNVLKSYRVMSELGRYQGNEFLDAYFEEVTPYISGITIYYTIIPSTKIPTINKYGRDRGGVKSVSPVEFLKELSSAYPHCCAWKYLSGANGNSSSLLMLDFFQGEVTPAWEQITKTSNIAVSTDDTNPFIATADIVTKIVDNRLYISRGKLFTDDILSCFKQKMVSVDFIDQLEYIVPIRRDKMEVHKLLVHPAVFVLKEGLDNKTMGEASERNIIESSPAFESILNFAYRHNGYYKFFNAKTDMCLISEGDYFVYFGENGKKSGTYLTQLGFNVSIVSINEIKNL